ncbi:MAG: lactate utilization protein [Thiolinea sp.]
MSNAKQQILSRLREPQRPQIDTTGRDYLSKFAWSTEERIQRFTDKMQAVRAEIHRTDRDNWRDLVSELCRTKGLSNLLLSAETEWGQAIMQQPEQFPALKHYDRDIEDWKQEIFYDTDGSLTSTLGGIAETGSLILWPNQHEPRMMSLVPPVHIAMLEVDKLFTTFAEAVQEQGWAKSGMPANALLISGPSKSADIAQVLAYGVHGPKELVVILID